MELESLRVIEAAPDPADAFSAIAAVLTCDFSSSLAAKTPLLADELRSVSVIFLIAVLTTSTASIAVSRMVLKADVSMPLALARLLLACVSSKARSAVFVRSKEDPAAALA